MGSQRTKYGDERKDFGMKANIAKLIVKGDNNNTLKLLVLGERRERRPPDLRDIGTKRLSDPRGCSVGNVLSSVNHGDGKRIVSDRQV